jgi:two-component system cell cycle sensor histidine kinase PleC
MIGYVMVLAVCTMASLQHLLRADAHDRAASGSRASAAAEILAARADGAIARLGASEQAAAETLARNPSEPLDAAEQALRLSRPLASGAAVVVGQQVSAATGATPDIAWKAVAGLARRSAKAVWVGAPPADAQGRHGRLTFVATAVPQPAAPSGVPAVAKSEPAYIVLAADLTPLTASASGQKRFLAAPDGVILAASGYGAQINTQADTLADLGGDPAQARRPGHAGSLSTAVSAERGLIAGVDTPAISAASLPATAINLLWLIAPLLVGCGLIVLLLLQTRKAHAAQSDQTESEQKFRLAVEAARCGIWEWRLRDNTVSMSDVTGVMLGWGGGGFASTDDVIARIAPEHQDRVRQALAGARSFGAFDVTFCVPKADGVMAWIDARGQAFGEPDALGYASIIGVALDVTEERTAERRFQAAERRLRDAIDSVSEAFVLYDRKGRLLMCNTNFRDFFGIEPRALKPGSAHAMVEKVAALAIKSTSPAPVGQRGVREVEMVDGRWLQISERRTAEGGLVVTAADVTALKRQEEARRLNEEALENAVARLEESRTELTDLAAKYQAEKLKAETANTAKSEFLANMSHELRTPLNAVNGFSEIMVNEMFGPLGDVRYKEYCQDILSSGQHLLALINDILDMSKIEAGKMALSFEWIDMGELVEEAVRLMGNRADAAALTLACTVPPGLPEIEADYRAVKQVLLNLLSNAIKFTPAGGRIDVKVWALGDETGSPRLQIAVSDTGIGIAKADIPRLGRPFEQIETNHSKTQQGTGLGLALTRSLIEMHAGAFELTSEPGQGTTASFTLPLQRKVKAKAKAVAA